MDKKSDTPSPPRDDQQVPKPQPMPERGVTREDIARDTYTPAPTTGDGYRTGTALGHTRGA